MQYFALFIFMFGLASSAFGQTYSKDLDDIMWTAYVRQIAPIGDVGDIQTIVDLRGFIPLSYVSKAKSDGFHLDVVQWYQIPTLPGVARLYYGDWKEATMEKLSRITLLTEEKLTGENLEWAKFAYTLAKTSGNDLFKSAGGSAHELDASEPVAVLLTARSAIVLLSFKYTSLARQGTGQVLCGFEFSRMLKEYKTFYEIHSTIIVGRSTKKAFENSLPYVTKALSVYFFRSQ